MGWEVRGAGLERRGWKEAGWGVGEGPVQARKDSHALGDPGCSGEAGLERWVCRSLRGDAVMATLGRAPALCPLPLRTPEKFSAVAGLGKLHLGPPYLLAPSSAEGAPSPHPTVSHVVSFPNDTRQANVLQY